MTGRRFNYTGRVRITRDRVHAALLPGEPFPELTARLDLEGLDLEPENRVVFEVYLQSAIERVEMGTVGDLKTVVARPLTRFNDMSGLRCRAKVISTSSDQPGLIRGIADGLRPEGIAGDDSSGQPLLPFVVDQGLGQRLWRLDMTEDAPIVRVNPAGGHWHQLIREPRFVQLVLPEILDRIVRWVAANRLGDEEDGAIADWTLFLEHLGADVESLLHTTPEDDIDAIADDVVQRFAGAHSLADNLAAELEEDDG